jgi:PAS domain S-box-containing protein
LSLKSHQKSAGWGGGSPGVLVALPYVTSVLATAAIVYAACGGEPPFQAWTLLVTGFAFATLSGALLLFLARRVASLEGVARHLTEKLVREAAESSRAAEGLRRIEDALRAGEERCRALAEQSSDFIARQQMNGVLTYVSPACRSFLGYAPEMMVGKSFFDFLDPADVEPVRERIRAAAAAGPGIDTVSHRVRRTDGTSFSLETTLCVLRDPLTQSPREVLTSSRDVSARKSAQGVRENLLSVLSHDLKNPLAAVLGFAAIVRDLAPDDPQREEFLSRIEANAHSALGVLTNFVDASRIQNGSLTPSLQRVSLNEAIERVLRQQDSRARVKNIRLEAHLDPSLPMALLDPQLIDRVIANLVSNALKSSPTKGSIRVETAARDGSVAVRVHDRGPGIPADQRASLFQSFDELGSRSDSQRLGLSVVRALVEAQGGTVGTESPPEGGTILEIVFPASGSDA